MTRLIGNAPQTGWAATRTLAGDGRASEPVVGTDAVASRELALRMPWLVFGSASVLLLLYAAPRLTTAAFAAARADAPPR